MRLVLLLLVFISIVSCGVDREKIIGQEFDCNALPYGEGGAFDEIFLNGVRQKVFVVYYKNKALVYIYNNDGYIVDYYLSDFASYEKVKSRILVGSEYSKVIKKMGMPFTEYKDSEFYKEFYDEFDTLQDSISVLYYQKWLWKEKKEYDVSSYRVLLEFDLDGKLQEITTLRISFP
ncbi:MAG: hypothetical protein LBV17_02330 [Treponema sp.]|jgi:hypothetical protein|nr:hypothetical protein [Treponema sp.]